MENNIPNCLSSPSNPSTSSFSLSSPTTSLAPVGANPLHQTSLPMHLIETLTKALMALSSVSAETWATSVSSIVSKLNENGRVREWVELLLLVLMNELLGFLGSRTRSLQTTVHTEAETGIEPDSDFISEASEEGSVSDQKSESESKSFVDEPTPVSEWRLGQVPELELAPVSEHNHISAKKSEQTADPGQNSESVQAFSPDQTLMLEHEAISDQESEHGGHPMPDPKLVRYEKLEPEQKIMSKDETGSETVYKPEHESFDNVNSESQKENPVDKIKHTLTGCEAPFAPKSEPQPQQEEPSTRQTCGSNTENTGALIIRPGNFLSYHLPLSSSPTSTTSLSLPSNDQLPPELLQLPLMNEHNPMTGQIGHDLNIHIEALSKFTPNAEYEIREPIMNAFQIRFINRRVGWGLFATQNIPAGSIILADELISVWSREQNACKTPQDTHAMLERKSKQMGKDWYAKFLLMARSRMTGKKRPTARERKLGILTANWEHYHLPISWEGKVGGILGLNLAWANHACIPNCTVSLSTEYGTDENGQVRWDKKPRLGRAIIRACSGIRTGEEITIPYMQTGGTANMRKKNMVRRFGFPCSCRTCAIPNCGADKILSKYHHLVREIYNPNNIADKPAVAFQAAADLTAQAQFVRTNDSRLINIWVYCAFIAGHHSDLARAHCFLKQARQLVLIAEGPGSKIQRRISKWQECMTTMPGFGTTNRGLSIPMEADLILKGDDEYDSKLLFMLDARPDEYLRVSRYRPRPCGSGTEQQWEIIDGPDPAPPKLSINAKSPSSMCRDLSCYRAVMVAKKMERKRREDRRHPNRQANSGCIDPEKDLMEILFGLFYEEFAPELKARKRLGRNNRNNAYQMVSEIIDGLHKCFGIGCREANCTYWHHDVKKPDPCSCDDKPAQQNQGAQVQDNPEKAKKKKKQKKGKQKAGETPVVQDVGAEKNVTVVEGIVCPDAGGAKHT